MKTKRKNKIFIVVGIFVLTCIGTIVILYNNTTLFHSKMRFPMWEEAVNSKTTDGIILQFKEITYDLGGGSGRPLHADVYLDMINQTGNTIGYGRGYRIDFLENGSWFTIYRPEAVPAYAIVFPNGETHAVEYYAPNTLFSEAGVYRIYIDDMGYCEIDMLMSKPQ